MYGLFPKDIGCKSPVSVPLGLVFISTSIGTMCTSVYF